MSNIVTVTIPGEPPVEFDTDQLLRVDPSNLSGELVPIPTDRGRILGLKAKARHRRDNAKNAVDYAKAAASRKERARAEAAKEKSTVATVEEAAIMDEAVILHSKALADAEMAYSLCSDLLDALNSKEGILTLHWDEAMRNPGGVVPANGPAPSAPARRRHPATA